jgi:hypothetical protein
MKQIRNDLIIVDNFLTEPAFERLYELTQKAEVQLTERVFWVLSDIVNPHETDNDEKHHTQLVHNFGQMDTMHYLYDAGVMDRLGCLHMERAKMNIGFRTLKPISSGFHYDIASQEMQKGETNVDELTGVGLKTAVLYMNDCNGGTLFEDGTFMQSKRNRLVEFPRELKHSGVSTTDAPRRTVLNLNYIPLNYFPAHGKNRHKDGD